MKEESPTILVVEDEELDLKMIKAHLTSAGYRVSEAVNGEEALRKAEQGPDLIVLDILMPGMDGFETCWRLRENEATRDIPLIFLSVLEDPRTKAFGLEIGSIDYVSKPFEPQELLARIKTHLTIRKQELRIRDYANRLEQMVEERTSQLIHASRLATLGTFCAAIAHEINNPNTFIAVNAQSMRLLWSSLKPVAERHAHEDPGGRVGRVLGEMEKMAEGVLEGSRRISRIVNNLRTYARQGDGREEKHRLSDAVNDALGLLNHRLKHHIEVELKIPHQLEIYCDRQKITQVFVNLLSNSLDAIGRSGGKVSISATRIGEKIAIRVRDTGPGIPGEVGHRAFDPFFTTKDRSRGTGLGLSIVRAIIEEHGGKISLMPFAGAGAEFHIALPLPEKDEEVTR